MIEIKKVSSTEYHVTFDGQTVVTISPEALMGMDFNGLVGLELALSQERSALNYNLRHYDLEKKAKKTELVNRYRNEGMKKTEAELEVEADEVYKGIKQMINSILYTIEQVDNLLTMVRRFIQMKFVQESQIDFSSLMRSGNYVKEG